MPFIHVYAYESRSVEQQRQLVKDMTDVVCSAYGVKPQTVHIYVFDQRPNDTGLAGVLAIDEPKP
jgi:4-oxalocrotonate tautomerase family enzyme